MLFVCVVCSQVFVVVVLLPMVPLLSFLKVRVCVRARACYICARLETHIPALARWLKAPRCKHDSDAAFTARFLDVT